MNEYSVACTSGHKALGSAGDPCCVSVSVCVCWWLIFDRLRVGWVVEEWGGDRREFQAVGANHHVARDKYFLFSLLVKKLSELFVVIVYVCVDL